MEPPRKKLRPYVTKWERKKAEENAAETEKLLNSDESNLKGLFLTNETVLQYQDKYHRNNLPR